MTGYKIDIKPASAPVEELPEEDEDDLIDVEDGKLDLDDLDETAGEEE